MGASFPNKQSLVHWHIPCQKQQLYLWTSHWFCYEDLTTVFMW